MTGAQKMIQGTVVTMAAGNQQDATRQMSMESTVKKSTARIPAA